MRFYELTILISPDSSQENISALLQKVSDFILKENGAIQQKSHPFLQKLGYALNKKSEAFSVSVNFSLVQQSLENLEKILKSEKAILRFMILTKESPEKIRKKAARMKPRRIAHRPRLTAEKEMAPRQSDSQKIDISEIDKKIEEILKE